MRTLTPSLLFLVVLLGGCRTGEPFRLRVMAYNIHHGAGMDRRLDLPRIADLIRKQAPDVVTLQEVDEGCGRTGGIDQARRLGELTGMHHAFGSFMDYDGGRYGMALLSRHPFVDVENHRLPDGAEPRTALAGRIRPSGGGPSVLIVGIHLYRTPAERLAQARRVFESCAGEDGPVILAGDFNSRPGGAVMNFLAESWHVASKGVDRFTFPSRNADREIDFILVRPQEWVRVTSHDVLEEPLASDHRPIVADVVIEPARIRGGRSRSRTTGR